MDLDTHVAEFKREGLTVFPGYFSADRVASLREVLDPEFERLFSATPDQPKLKITPLLGHPVLGPMLADRVLDPLVLDFAEAVMGPVVQLDSYEVSGFPPSDREMRGQVHGWHRDPFHVADQYARLAGGTGSRPYTPPLACNCLTYLQDMDEDSGPICVVPRSHLDDTVIEPEREGERHPRQRTLELAAGDMVFMHNDLLHTGSYDVTHRTRYFVSKFVCHFGFPHRDPFDLPLIAELRARARAQEDRRVLRFFGEDDTFVARREAAWAAWCREERSALKIAE